MHAIYVTIRLQLQGGVFYESIVNEALLDSDKTTSSLIVLQEINYSLLPSNWNRYSLNFLLDMDVHACIIPFYDNPFIDKYHLKTASFVGISLILQFLVRFARNL